MIYRFTDSFSGIGLTCGIEDGYIVALSFGGGEGTKDPPPEALSLWGRTRCELLEYFAGSRRSFDLPLRYSGTAFRRAVWEGLRRIPYGETRSYGELAAEIGRPKAARAVGGACHANPIAVIIPCHRVLGTGGSLTGFGGGLEVKEKLLRLEGAELR